MSGERLTVRFSEAEADAIERLALSLNMTKAQVLRLAVENLGGGAKTMDAVQQMQEQTAADMGARVDRLGDQTRKSFALLLRIVQAPPEAEEALKKVWGV